MLRKELEAAAVTILPLSLTAVALWVTHAAYQAYLFDALDSAKLGAFAMMIVVHLFAPVWAGTRPKWFTAAIAQLALIAVNDILFLRLILTRAHDYVEVSQCGMAGLMYCLMAITGFVIWIPLTLVGARDLHRGLAE